MDLAEKLEAALVSVFAGQTYPDYFDPANQVRPGEFDEDIDNQYLRCRAANQAEAETPLDSGNFWWACELEVRTPAAIQTDAEAASGNSAESNSQLTKHQTVSAVMEAGLLVDDLPAQLNAAAAALGAGYELRVFAIQDRIPTRSVEDDVYSSGWTFRVYCCSTAIAD